jgi:hypothetical protein
MPSREPSIKGGQEGKLGAPALLQLCFQLTLSFIYAPPSLPKAGIPLSPRPGYCRRGGKGGGAEHGSGTAGADGQQRPRGAGGGRRGGSGAALKELIPLLLKVAGRKVLVIILLAVARTALSNRLARLQVRLPGWSMLQGDVRMQTHSNPDSGQQCASIHHRAFKLPFPPRTLQRSERMNPANTQGPGPGPGTSKAPHTTLRSLLAPPTLLETKSHAELSPRHLALAFTPQLSRRRCRRRRCLSAPPRRATYSAPPSCAACRCSCATWARTSRCAR